MPRANLQPNTAESEQLLLLQCVYLEENKEATFWD